MAQKKNIQFSGIQRALPQSIMPDGACQEIINARRRKGCLRPVGDKVQYKSFSVSDYTEIWLHDIENGIVPGESNHIGYKKDIGMLFLIHPTTGASTEIIRNETHGVDVNVVFLKRTMIVVSESGVETFLFVENSETSVKSYVQTATLKAPDVDLNKANIENIITDAAYLASAVLGGYYEKLNSVSQTKGQMYGSIMYITAYRLFDGSYILPSIPRYFEISNGGFFHRGNPGGGSSDDREFDLRFTVASINATINNELYPSSIESTKDLIDSICLFATKATPLHKIDETVITDTFLNSFSSAEALANQDFKNKLFVSDDFQKLAKSIGWYKIHEFNFEDIVGKTGKTTKDIDTKGFYQDYATRDTLTTDQFTHHKLSAKATYVYNDRLHLLNIKTTFGLPYVIWPDSNENYSKSSEFDGVISVWSKTSIGNSVTQSSVKIPVYIDAITLYYYALNYTDAQNKVLTLIAASSTIPGSVVLISKGGSAGWEYIVEWKEYDGSTPYLILPEVVGYNDSRAYKMQVAVTISGTTYKLFEETLVKNSTMNFSYWHNTTFNVDQTNATANYKLTKNIVTDITSGYPAITPPSVIELQFDTNRLQVSEIQNPLIFPAKNSYQIGTGNGIAMCAGSEPLSTGQFGQFPLQVFTSKGIWALEIGLSDVLYTNILPVNGEVADNPKNIISVGSGVIYSTVKGLFIVNGRQVVEISEIIENNFEVLELINSPEITELLTNTKYVPGLVNSLSDVDFIDYLSSSSIGYDHINKELVVTNKNKGYSYIYSFDNQSWYTISKSFKLLINSYPKLLGVTETNILSLSDETDNNNVECLIVSSAQSFESPEAFKKIEQAILRTRLSIEDSKTATFAIFASDDLKAWQLLTGRVKSGSGQIDMNTQRTHVSVKYYAFVFAGKISTDSEIKQLEIIFNIKWNNRSR